ncbi:MAG: CHAT domain-containing protein [Lachnospiraceae bacterium]|nr:CHAT domain-containing protein [Lachnospiraceae bacterium]
MEQAIRENTFVQSQMQAEIENLKAIPETITVLFLAANPITTSRLGLDEEVRSIQEKIRLSEYRDSIRFESRGAVRASDILQAINETNPTIVHFSGHGAVSGELVLQNPDGTEKLVSQEAITMTIATASDTIRLVVFNACFSQQQAESVVEHIEAAIGMSDSITDETACVFAAQLYSSIGFGRSLKTSFDQAKAVKIHHSNFRQNVVYYR